MNQRDTYLDNNDDDDVWAQTPLDPSSRTRSWEWQRNLELRGVVVCNAENIRTSSSTDLFFSPICPSIHPSSHFAHPFKFSIHPSIQASIQSNSSIYPSIHSAKPEQPDRERKNGRNQLRRSHDANATLHRLVSCSFSRYEILRNSSHDGFDVRSILLQR